MRRDGSGSSVVPRAEMEGKLIGSSETCPVRMGDSVTSASEGGGISGARRGGSHCDKGGGGGGWRGKSGGSVRLGEGVRRSTYGRSIPGPLAEPKGMDGNGCAYGSLGRRRGGLGLRSLGSGYGLLRGDKKRPSSGDR